MTRDDTREGFRKTDPTTRAVSARSRVPCSVPPPFRRSSVMLLSFPPPFGGRSFFCFSFSGGARLGFSLCGRGATPGLGGGRPPGGRALPLKPPPPPPPPAITPADLMTRLNIFSDDSMEGRRVGTE